MIGECNKKYKRKWILFGINKFDSFQIGFSFMFEPEYKEDPAINPAHAHFWVDIAFWSFSITLGDMIEC